MQNIALRAGRNPPVNQNRFCAVLPFNVISYSPEFSPGIVLIRVRVCGTVEGRPLAYIPRSYSIEVCRKRMNACWVRPKIRVIIKDIFERKEINVFISFLKFKLMKRIFDVFYAVGPIGYILPVAVFTAERIERNALVNGDW